MIVKKDGTKVRVNIGENENDPVFVITDLLVHLAGKQMSQKASEVVEETTWIFSSEAARSQKQRDWIKKQKEAVKAGVLRLLAETYGIEEEDFTSAELEIVPAGKARDCGIDRSMIISYGQDDRVCAFTSLFAMLDNPQISRTACCILVDKEEIGSVGATGMHSKFI